MKKKKITGMLLGAAAFTWASIQYGLPLGFIIFIAIWGNNMEQK